MSDRRRGRPEKPRTGYGARLCELRREKNLTAQQAAERWGITTAYRLYSYENGRTKIPVDVMMRIADRENVSTDWLLGRTDERRTER